MLRIHQLNGTKYAPELAQGAPGAREQATPLNGPAAQPDRVPLRAPIRPPRHGSRRGGDGGLGRRGRGGRREAGEPTDLGAGRAAGEVAGEEVPDLAEAEVRRAVAPRDGGCRRGRVPPRAAHGDGVRWGRARVLVLEGEGAQRNGVGTKGAGA